MGPWRTPDWHALGPPRLPVAEAARPLHAAPGPRAQRTAGALRHPPVRARRTMVRCRNMAVGPLPSAAPALQPAPFGIFRIFDRRLNRAPRSVDTGSVPAAVWRYGDTHTAGAAESWRRWRMLLARPARAPGRSGTGAWRRRSVFRRWPAWQQALVVRGAGAASLRGGAGRC